MARIATVGSALQDIYFIDRGDFASTTVAGQAIFKDLTIGSKVDIDRVKYTVGGGGTNAAVTFARYGHEAIFIGNIARDAAGEAVLACLDEEGIDNSYINYLRGDTGTSVILVDAKSGEHTILIHRGVSAKAQNLRVADLELIAPDWLYVSSLGGEMETLLELFEEAHRIGTKVMFNPGSCELAAEKQLIGLLSEVDVLMLNKTEAARIVPGVLLTELLGHLAAYCPTVLLTDGSMGSIATDRKEVYRLGVYEQVRVRDLTGAGDAFGSGFLAKYADGASFRDALEFAAANSASVVQKYGAKAGILTGKEELHPMPIQAIKDLQFT